MTTAACRGQTSVSAMGRKMSFFEFWRSKKERTAQLQRAFRLRLLPSQLKQLHGDGAVRSALQNCRVASLLPPVGTDVLRPYTPASHTVISPYEEEEKDQGKRKENKEVKGKEHPKPARDLEAEKPLPFFYGDPSLEHLNIPLEELDPFYQTQKTFLVLHKGNIIDRFNADKSCYLLSPLNPLRTVAIKILSHSVFSALLLVTLLINYILMTFSHPFAVLKIAEFAFIGIYTAEVIIKVLARGFCVGKFTFLRDPWNWLDVMVIITAYLTLFVDIGKFSVLSSVPRILKMIPLLPGLKMAAHNFIQLVKRLMGVFILVVLTLSFLAMLGLQLFMGRLSQKCVVTPGHMTHHNLTSDILNPLYYDNESRSSFFDFNKYRDNPDNMYFLHGHRDPLLCGNSSDAGVCPEGFTCLLGGLNPNYGYTNYDTFGWSLLSFFRLMTRDFWENLIQLTLRSAGKSYLIFFMLFISPGCFILVSLIVAVSAMVCCEQELARVADAAQKEEEFKQIVEVLKRREEEVMASRVVLSDREDGDNNENQELHTATEESGHQKSSLPCCSILADLFLKWNCCSCWRWLKQRLYTVVMNPFFDLVIVICLVINIIFMAMEHYPMTSDFEMHLSASNLVFTCIFTVEMVIKIVAMDPYNYFKVNWNVFESIIVAISLLELGLDDISGLSVLRCFRLLRIFRLARWWYMFNVFLDIMWTATFLLLTGFFAFTVVGMQLFQKEYKDSVCRIADDCELPRWHMNDYFHTFLLIFRIFNGSWIETLWDCMEVSGQGLCLTFFIVVVVIGNLLMLHLFLVLLLNSMSKDIMAPEEQKKHSLQIALDWRTTWIMEHICSCLRRNNYTKTEKTVESQKENKKDYVALNLVTSDQLLSKETDLKMPEKEALEKHGEVQEPQDGDGHREGTPEDCCFRRCYGCCPFLDVDTSQGVGRFWFTLRKACLLVVQNKYFDFFVDFVVLLSSIVLVFEDIHQQQREVLQAVLNIAELVFTVLFLLEMLLKWMGFGLKKYFSTAWCWLEFLIVNVFLVSLMANMLGFSGLGTIKILRVLRILSRFQGPRLVSWVLVQTIPSMLNGLLVCEVVWLIFSIMGVNMFAGKFYYCVNETTQELFLRDAVNNKTECYSLIQQNFTDVRWKNAKFNYDNVAMGYLSLMILGLSGGWFQITYSAVDSAFVESQPSYENNMYMYQYITFFIFCSFFTLNLFVRIILSDLQKEKFGGKHIFMTEQQLQYSKLLMKLFPKNPKRAVPRPQNKCQAQLFDLVNSPYFEVFMVVLICLGVVSLMVESRDQSVYTEEILYWVHFIFIIIFLIEVILKIIAFRQYYFKDNWNIIDFVVIIVTIFGLFIADFLEYYFVSPSVFSLLRLFRIGRILHFIPWTRGIRKLILAFVKSIPALFNISIVLFLMMIVYSMFGMFNFANVKKGFMIDDMFNFETFWSSMICLFMTSSSSAWTDLLMPIMNTPPDCDPYAENPGTGAIGECSNPVLGVIFFITYILLTFLLIIHLYITVVVEIFDSEDTEGLCDDDLQTFFETWKTFDPEDTQFIPYSKLPEFCDSLQGPLRSPKPNTVRLTHMDLPLFSGDRVHCSDVLLSLAKQVLADAEEMETLKARMEKKFKFNKELYEPISTTLRRKEEEVAAKVIQRAYRKALLQHKDGEEKVKSAVDVSDSSHLGVPE